MTKIINQIRGVTGSDPARRRVVYLVSAALLILVGTGLRCAGSDFGQPHAFHPDEHHVMQAARYMAESLRSGGFGEFDYFIPYPPGLGNQVGLLAAVSGLADGGTPALRQVGRAYVLVLAVLGLILVALTGRAIAGPAGALAALSVLAVSPLAVEQSRYATTDVPTATGLALVAYLAVGLARAPRYRTYLLGGLAVGFAASFKYVGALGGGLLLVAHLFSDGRRDLGRWLLLGAAGVISGAVFLLLNFEIVHSWQAFVEGISYSYGFYREAPHAGYFSDANWFHVPYYLLRVALGLPVAAVLLLAPWLIYRQGVGPTRWAVIFLAGGLAYVLFLCTRYVFAARQLMHVLALLAIGIGGLFATGTWPRVEPWLRRVVAALLALGLLVNLGASAGFAWTLREPDTRIAAARWLEANLPAGTRVALVPETTWGTYTPPVDPGRISLVRTPRLPMGSYRQAGFRYLLVSWALFNRFLRSPGEFPTQVAQIESWLEVLRSRARLVATFAREPGPGADLFGASVDIYHNPRMELYELSEVPGGQP